MTLEKEIKHPKIKKTIKSEIQIFDPKIEVHNILKGNKNERKNKLDEFREKLIKQYIDISSILNDFETITIDNPNISFEDCLNKITFTKNIPSNIIKEIINGFKEYFKDRKESIKKLNKYKNNKTLLIKELYNSDYIPKGEINISVYGACLLVEFKNKKDYENINSSRLIGTYRNFFKLISIKGNNKNTLKHEYQHYINSKLIKNEFPNFPDYGKSDTISYFKQYEILKEYKILKEKYYKKKLLDEILDELIARENDNSSEFSSIMNVLSNNSPYLDFSHLNKDKQINYGINLLKKINILREKYPLIYDYLILVLKDSHSKYFFNKSIKGKTNIIKTKLKISNILTNKNIITLFGG